MYASYIVNSSRAGTNVNVQYVTPYLKLYKIVINTVNEEKNMKNLDFLENKNLQSNSRVWELNIII